MPHRSRNTHPSCGARQIRETRRPRHRRRRSSPTSGRRRTGILCITARIRSRQVELLIPQVQFLDADGAQGERWELSKNFLGVVNRRNGITDAGAAALLKYQWKDAKFGFSSLSERKPVVDEGEIVVMIIPDYQMLEYVERIASQLSDDPIRTRELCKLLKKRFGELIRALQGHVHANHHYETSYS